MPYTKHDWQSGEIIREENMDNLEKGVETANQIADKLLTDIASVETTTYASRAYSAGEYLMLANQLYKVTADIASGGTLSVGTNISAVNVMSQVRALSDSATSIESKLPWKGALPSCDLNGVTTAGIYTLARGVSYTNAPQLEADLLPVSATGVFEVLRSSESDYVIEQIVYDDQLGERFYRTSINGGSSWGSWVRGLSETHIADNLTTNDATKVLSAKQGKVLNDSLSMVYKEYTYTYTNIAADADFQVLGRDVDLSTPTGYYPLAIRTIGTGSTGVLLRYINPIANAATTFMALHNVSNSAMSGTASVQILYGKNISRVN